MNDVKLDEEVPDLDDELLDLQAELVGELGWEVGVKGIALLDEHLRVAGEERTPAALREVRCAFEDARRNGKSYGAIEVHRECATEVRPPHLSTKAEAVLEMLLTKTFLECLNELDLEYERRIRVESKSTADSWYLAQRRSVFVRLLWERTKTGMKWVSAAVGLAGSIERIVERLGRLS